HLEHAGGRLTPALEAFGIEQVVHDDEAVAEKDAGRALDLVRLADLEALDAVHPAEALAQLLHIRIVIAAGLRRARIDATGGDVRNDGAAVFVGRFVGRRGGAPADRG